MSAHLLLISTYSHHMHPGGRPRRRRRRATAPCAHIHARSHYLTHGRAGSAGFFSACDHQIGDRMLPVPLHLGPAQGGPARTARPLARQMVRACMANRRIMHRRRSPPSSWPPRRPPSWGSPSRGGPAGGSSGTLPPPRHWLRGCPGRCCGWTAGAADS